MLPEAAALVVALTLAQARGGGRAELRAATAASNAARAKLGLLPRKAPAKAGPVYRNGRRIVPLAASAPTFLGEPGTLPAGGEAAPPEPRRLRLSAHGVSTDVTLSMRFDR